jgi:O-antigen/teichoic acid export membrane protein
VSENYTQPKLISTFLSVLGNVSAAILPLLFIPIFHQNLSSEEFGAWNTALAFGGIVVLLDFGIKSELLSRLSRSLAGNDGLSTRSVMTCALAALTTTVIIGMALTLFSVLMLSPVAFSYSKTLIAVTIGSVVTMVGQAASSVFLAQGLVIRNSALQILGISCAGLVCYFSLGRNLEFWFVAFAYSATPGLVLIAAASHQIARKEFLRPSLNLVDRFAIREMVYSSFGYFRLTVVMVVAHNSDIIIVSSKFGFLSSEIFSIPARIGSLFALVIVGINMPLWSKLAIQLDIDHGEKQRKILVRNSLLGFVAVATVGTVAIFFGNEVVRHWIGASLPQQVSLIGAFTSQNIVVALYAPFIVRLCAIGDITGLTWSWVAYIVISIPLKVLFTTNQSLDLIPFISATCYAIVMVPALFLKKPTFRKPNEVKT